MLDDSPPFVLLLSMVTGYHFSTSTPISNESTATSTEPGTDNNEMERQYDTSTHLMPYNKYQKITFRTLLNINTTRIRSVL